MKLTLQKSACAFTLIELLVVIALISILAAILFPVYATTRDKARQTACLTDLKQIGLGLELYLTDYDDHFPGGLGIVKNERIWAGEGWAGQCKPYTKNTEIYSCPSDSRSLSGPFNFKVSYGFNANMIDIPGEEDDEHTPTPPGFPRASLNSPPRSVLLFEVSGVFANIADPREGADEGHQSGKNYSASANGLDNRLYAQRDWETRTENQYATGYLGGRLPHDPHATQFALPKGRHTGGSNYLLSDGHAKWSFGDGVSSGLNATLPGCYQDNRPPRTGCQDEFHAEGTEADGHQSTFSIR